MMKTARPFLAAQWRYLLMINFEIDPHILQPLLPWGVELDTFGNRHYVSMVGFRFLDTRLRGWAIPYHRHFDEVNMRFYVRCQGPEGVRRGVVFIKEVVPRRAIATIARRRYNENYVACPMKSQLNLPGANGTGTVGYAWRSHGIWHEMKATFAGEPVLPASMSEEEFITEHYWGYSAQRDGTTVEYRVEHPPWRIWPAQSVHFMCDVARFYGPAFVAPLSAKPHSTLVAEGSAITVSPGNRLPIALS